MNFIDHRLSAQVSAELRRIIEGRTQIVTLDNGDEARNANWKYNKLKYHANFSQLGPQSQDELVRAFYAARAQLYLFRIADAADNQALNEPLDVKSGSRDAVQLTKIYRFGPSRAERLIQAINQCEVRDSHGRVVEGDVDRALGLFTPKESWKDDAYVWNGRFDVWVRFGSDQLETTLMRPDVATSDLELWEMRARR